MTAENQRLCTRLGYQFKQPALLDAALSHRSVRGPNNERLEFLGDAILGLLIAEELYQRYPHATEGKLSRYRAHLVKGDTLAELARELKLGEHLRLGAGEYKSGGFKRASILADAFEAVIAAVYLDCEQDFSILRPFVLALFGDRLENLAEKLVVKDPKTRLQEYLQGRQLALPEYQVVDITGKAHDQTFHVVCQIEPLEKQATGAANSRRKAEQIAAAALLKILGEK